MAQESVEDFRDVIDTTIQRQKEDAGNVSWPNMDTTARAGGIIFGSYSREDSRPHTFSVPASGGAGWPEHVWGVSFEGWQRIEGVQRLGLLAVVSTVDRPDSLLRHWCIGKEVGLSIDTVQEVGDPEDMGDIIDFIRSPHLARREVLGKIAVLSADELTEVQNREAEMNERQAELRRDLERLNENRRRARENAQHVFLR